MHLGQAQKIDFNILAREQIATEAGLLPIGNRLKPNCRLEKVPASVAICSRASMLKSIFWACPSPFQLISILPNIPKSTL